MKQSCFVYLLYKGQHNSVLNQQNCSFLCQHYTGLSPLFHCVQRTHDCDPEDTLYLYKFLNMQLICSNNAIF